MIDRLITIGLYLLLFGTIFYGLWLIMRDHAIEVALDSEWTITDDEGFELPIEWESTYEEIWSL